MSQSSLNFEILLLSISFSTFELISFENVHSAENGSIFESSEILLELKLVLIDSKFLPNFPSILAFGGVTLKS